MNDEDFADMRELIDNLRIRIERLERVVHNLMNSNSGDMREYEWRWNRRYVFIPWSYG